MAYETILYEKRNRVAYITLNRPDKLNALSPELYSELTAALQEADHDDAVRSLVITGAGRAWSAGADMGRAAAEAPARPPTAEEMLIRQYTSGQAGLERNHIMCRLTKPVIAALNGYTLGAGFELAMTFDMRIASEQAILGAPEIRHGSTITTTLPYLIGPMWAKRLILTGDQVTAQKAVEIGLVLEAVPHEQLMERATALAERIAMVPPLAVRLNKRMLDGVQENMGIEQARSYAALIGSIIQVLTPGSETADGRNFAELRSQEGMRAFLEARDGPFGRAPLA